MGKKTESAVKEGEDFSSKKKESVNRKKSSKWAAVPFLSLSLLEFNY